jgi:hypothetical protein
MGNFQSNVTQQAISDLTDIINQSTTTIVNNAVSQCNAINNATILLGSIPNGTLCPGPPITANVTVNQQAGVNCTLSSQNVNQITSQFQSAITSQAVQQAIQNSASIQQWLAAAVSAQISVADSETKIITHVTNYISNNVTNNCNNNANALNNGVVSVCGGYKGNIVLNQGVSVVAMTSCIYQTIIQAFTSDTVWNNVAQSADQKLSSTQEGIASIFIYIIIGIGILAIIGLIGGIIYAMINKGNKNKGGLSSDTLAELAKLKKNPKAVSPNLVKNINPIVKV